MTPDDILESLRVELGADRTTLRLDTPGMNYPCAGEAVGPGIASISHDNSLDQWGAATVQRVAATLRTLVQPDLSVSDTPVPAALVAAYGVQAQMLAPVLERGGIVGWVSAHSTTVRDWTDAEVAAIETAAAWCSERLDAIRAGSGYTRWLAQP